MTKRPKKTKLSAEIVRQVLVSRESASSRDFCPVKKAFCLKCPRDSAGSHFRGR